jgi:alpha-glucosidase
MEKQSGEASSMLSLYRRVINLRKNSRALSEGTHRTEANAPEDCFVFSREAANQRVMVALNFSEEPRRIEVPRASVLLSTDVNRREDIVSGVIDLAANEGVILQVV